VKHQEAFDEYFIVTDAGTGTPARNRNYRVVLDTSAVLEGVTDDEGRTQYATSEVRKPLHI